MSKKKKQSKQNQGQIKSCTLFVAGMHCASCEILIEKKLLKQEGIESVDASLKNNKVEINYIGDTRPDIESLNEEFESQGYIFSDKKFKRKDTPLFSFNNGSLTFNPQKVSSLFRVGVILASLIVAFFIFENLQLGKYVSVDASSSLPAFFLLGLVAGLSSCAALVGGLLLSMIKQWNELYIDSDSNTQKAQPHIMFHVGRLLSFMILGGVLGLLGSAVSFDNPVIFSILTIIISVVMFILAMQMLGVGWAQNFRFTAPKF
ncbi:MAG TPA: cation transporter, partial [Niabella sp.]|nr:cation transporter [Niabella sp.]